MITPLNQNVLTVLGMHRSGTSCLTGLFENMGVNLGTVSRNNPNNPKGNKENRSISFFNDALMIANGGNWHNPPLNVIWSLEHKRTLNNIISTYSEYESWGFKDPRTLFTLDGWIEAIPQLKMVGIFRHPFHVANSLRRRTPAMELDYAYGIWCRYNRKLIEHQDKYGFELISFDDKYFLDRFIALAQRIGLPAPAQAPDFFDPNLRHNNVSADALPKPVTDLYQNLLQRYSS